MTASERLSRFMDHLHSVFQMEPAFFPLDFNIPDAPKVVCMVYRDAPEPGHRDYETRHR